MDRSIVEQNARLVLNKEDVPARVVEVASSFGLQSTTRIALKPNQEPARIHICCVLAVEKLGSKLELPAPNTQKPPIPPAQYAKLLGQFRAVLAPKLGAPTTDPRTPTKRRSIAASSPSKRTPRAARNKAVSYLQDEIDDVGGDDGNDEDEDVLELELEDDEEEASPRKKPPSKQRLASPSPRKSPRKKIGGPQPKDIEALASKMGLQSTTADAVIRAFEQFHELVKDGWGLVFGLLCVISDRAEPVNGMEHEKRLVKAMGDLAPSVHIDRDEWIGWATKIVTGQSWIMAISSKPEPQPRLLGAPGGWGLGVEFNLVTNTAT